MFPLSNPLRPQELLINEILGRRSGSCLVAYGSNALSSALAEDAAITPRAEAVDVDSEFPGYLFDGPTAATQQVDGIPTKLLSVRISCV